MLLLEGKHKYCARNRMKRNCFLWYHEKNSLVINSTIFANITLDVDANNIKISTIAAISYIYIKYSNNQRISMQTTISSIQITWHPRRFSFSLTIVFWKKFRTSSRFQDPSIRSLAGKIILLFLNTPKKILFYTLLFFSIETFFSKR